MLETCAFPPFSLFAIYGICQFSSSYQFIKKRKYTFVCVNHPHPGQEQRLAADAPLKCIGVSRFDAVDQGEGPDVAGQLERLLQGANSNVKHCFDALPKVSTTRTFKDYLGEHTFVNERFLGDLVNCAELLVRGPACSKTQLIRCKYLLFLKIKDFLISPVFVPGQLT